MVVFTQTPKQMKSIKWFILNVSSTNFLLVVFHSLFQNVPIFYPLVTSMSKGPFGQFGMTGTYLALWLNTLLTLNLIRSYTALMWYQFGIFKGKGRLAEFVLSLKSFMMFYGSYTGLICVALFVMLRLCYIVDRRAIFQYISRNDTNLIRFVEDMLEDQPSAIVYAPHSNIWVSMFIIFFSIQALIELGMVVFFNILLIKTIKATSKIVTKKTLALQLSFYRSALIESLFVFIFVVSPALTPCILAIFNIEELRVGVIGFSMVIISAPLCFVMNMVLIRPYRRFFLKLIKCKFETSTNGVVKVQPAI